MDPYPQQSSSFPDVGVKDIVAVFQPDLGSLYYVSVLNSKFEGEMKLLSPWPASQNAKK